MQTKVILLHNIPQNNASHVTLFYDIQFVTQIKKSRTSMHLCKILKQHRNKDIRAIARVNSVY